MEKARKSWFRGKEWGRGVKGLVCVVVCLSMHAVWKINN